MFQVSHHIIVGCFYFVLAWGSSTQPEVHDPVGGMWTLRKACDVSYIVRFRSQACEEDSSWYLYSLFLCIQQI